MKKFAAYSIYCRRCDLYVTISIRISRKDGSKRRLRQGALGFTPRCCPYCGGRTLADDAVADVLAPEKHRWTKKTLVN